MKISIITVVFNSINTIEDTILSILSQTHDNFEIIVIDGNSNDGTIEILNKYKDKFSYYISENDNGIYDAMNKGIENSKGDIIGILNSDDVFYDQNILKKINEMFESDFELEILYGDILYVDYYNINNIKRRWISNKFYKKYFERGNAIAHPSLYLKRNVYDTAGKYLTKFKISADYEFILRIFKNYKFKHKYLEIIFVKMRLGGTSNKNIKNILLGNYEIYNSWKENNLNFPILYFPLKFLKKIKQYF